MTEMSHFGLVIFHMTRAWSTGSGNETTPLSTPSCIMHQRNKVVAHNSDPVVTIKTWGIHDYANLVMFGK